MSNTNYPDWQTIIKLETEKRRKDKLTVQELYDRLGEIIKNGDGDAIVEVDDAECGYYELHKSTKIVMHKEEQELYGKYCHITEG